MRKAVWLIWRNWIKPLFIYGIFFVVFRHWLDFDDKQSVVFAFLFGSGYLGFKELGKKAEKEDDFVPYRVCVNITKPRDFLAKYGLIKSDEDWKALCEKSHEPGLSVLGKGLNFTVLSLGREGGPHLIWWDDCQVFLAGLPSFEEEIKELELPHQFGSGSVTWSPRLYFGFEHGKGRGYTLALRLNSDWWKKYKTLDTVEIDEDYLTGAAYLVLAKLPYGELGLDYEARGQKRETELARSGWTIKDICEPETNWSMIEVQKDELSVSQRFCEM